MKDTWIIRKISKDITQDINLFGKSPYWGGRDTYTQIQNCQDFTILQFWVFLGILVKVMVVAVIGALDTPLYIRRLLFSVTRRSSDVRQ